MLRRPTSLLLALTLVVALASCSKNPTQSPATTNSISNQFGGITPTNESPAFGDPTLAAAGSEEQPYDDPMAGLSVFDSLMHDGSAGVFHFRAIWGHLRYDSTSTTPTNWDGSLTISRGLEIVRRIIRFEPATDSILPRTDRKKIEWASTTTVANDGIAVDIFIPPARPILDTTIQIVVDSTNDTTEVIVIDTLPPVPVTVAFVTGPYSRTFTLPELAALDTIVYLDDSNAVSFEAFQIDHLICPRGFLSGCWGYDSTGQGVFRGMWMSQHGDLTGYLCGHFETDSAGSNVFFGKWIDKSGLFEGLLRGTWGPHPNEHADDRAFERAGGWFKGGVFDGNGNRIGILAGKYKSSDSTDQPGFFNGRWKLSCPGFSDHRDHPDDGMDEGHDGDHGGND